MCFKYMKTLDKDVTLVLILIIRDTVTTIAEDTPGHGSIPECYGDGSVWHQPKNSRERVYFILF